MMLRSFLRFGSLSSFVVWCNSDPNPKTRLKEAEFRSQEVFLQSFGAGVWVLGQRYRRSTAIPTGRRSLLPTATSPSGRLRECWHRPDLLHPAPRTRHGGGSKKNGGCLVHDVEPLDDPDGHGIIDFRRGSAREGRREGVDASRPHGLTGITSFKMLLTMIRS